MVMATEIRPADRIRLAGLGPLNPAFRFSRSQAASERNLDASCPCSLLLQSAMASDTGGYGSRRADFSSCD